jgi:hypothetical protein
MKILSYQEWANRLLAEDPPEKIDCPECDGHGELDCECDECGHSHQVTCSACNGAGDIPFENAPDGWQPPESDYKHQVDIDRAALAEWLRTDPQSVTLECAS